jgi:cyclopropane fatty-acyl-phospholipid synthase-like methyltransferase
MAEVNLLKTYPKAVRDITQRVKDKEVNRALALKFGFEYFDGPREQGYGGYRYDGRWVPIARTFVAHFGLKPGDRVLDVGCAKGFLVKDLADVCPGLEVYGLDISEYALTEAHHDVAGRLVRGSCDTLPFDDRSFDAVICINTIHNLEPSRCATAIRELQRVSKGQGFIQVDAYRSAAERQLFEDWMLTAKTYYMPKAWEALLASCGYSGDYFWTVLE